MVAISCYNLPRDVEPARRGGPERGRRRDVSRDPLRGCTEPEASGRRPSKTMIPESIHYAKEDRNA
jgi:hypothetical protein